MLIRRFIILPDIASCVRVWWPRYEGLLVSSKGRRKAQRRKYELLFSRNRIDSSK